MALFQRRPQVDTLPLYTLGTEKTILIVGLGNVGKKYTGTRHNLGFMVLDDFAAKNEFPNWLAKKDLRAEISSHNLGGNRVILAKPTTYVNESGTAVQAIQQFYKITNSQTLVVYDELAMPFGQLRSRVGGQAAGHNGLKSLIEQVGADFGRLRIGIGSDLAAKADAAEFVLAKFSKTEQAKLPLITQEANAMLTEYIFSGQLPHDTRSVI